MKKPRIEGASGGSTGLRGELVLTYRSRTFCKRISGSNLEPDLIESAYNARSKILILFEQESLQTGLDEIFQPAYLSFPYLQLTALSHFIRGILHEKEAGRLDEIDFFDKIVYDPDHALARKKYIGSLTIYLIGLLDSKYARLSETYNFNATKMSKLQI
ncbi:hypothetical protein IFR05_010500 [Cadophora sp. M221]|nr:hypothetical protein IFR05_010500 [Cadophora sp. M221]